MTDAAPAEHPDRTTSAASRGVAALTVATLIWGSTFIVIHQLEVRGPTVISPGLQIFARFAVAALVFAPALRRGTKLWLNGLELGFWLWCGYGTQAIGLRYTGPSRSAFITALYVVFTPALAVLAGQRLRAVVIIAAAMALAGTALLSYDGSPPNRGDAWTLLAALTWAVYIFRLERAAKAFPARSLTAVQMVVVAAISIVWVGAERAGPITLTWRAGAMLVYLGLAATALTTWLQTIGQRTVPAAQAALLYAMEPVWAALFAWLVFGHRFGPKGWIGAAAILVAVVVSQWPAKPGAVT